MTTLELHNSITARLLFYRKLHDLTQAQLAKLLGYTDKSISKWERGEAIPDIDTLYALSEIYGITVSELIGQTPECKETQKKRKAAKKGRRSVERSKKRALERGKIRENEHTKKRKRQ